jgi:hypothetical protein
LGNFPSDDQSDWSDSLQGVTHDDLHWIFTQKTRIIKAYVGADLKRVNRKDVTKVRGMPEQLKRHGGNHFGDIDRSTFGGRDYLFVPVEDENYHPYFNPSRCGEQPQLAVFLNDARLTFLDTASLTQQFRSDGYGKAAWCAIHPITGVLYTSHTTTGPGRPILRYWVNWDLLDSKGQLELVPMNKLWPRNQERAVYEMGPYIQGGTFAPDGTLYLLMGKMYSSRQSQGIRVIDNRGRLVARSWSAKTVPQMWRQPYYYKHGIAPSPGFQYQTNGQDQEPEGITYWDTDRPIVSSVRHNRIAGQLHAMHLNKDLGDDNLWFKHYQVDPPASARNTRPAARPPSRR